MNLKASLHICETSEDFEIAKSLTQDYFKWLGMDLRFQDIDKEFKVFKKMYSAPIGSFIYLKNGDEIVGGVGVRMLEAGICEMKRLYIYNNHQGMGYGKLLCNEIISISKSLGYSKMRLDTVSKLESAIALYEKMGFRYIPKYYENPDVTAKYMELDLM